MTTKKPSLFANAPVVSEVSSKAKKSKTGRAEIEVNGLDTLAAFKILEKSLEKESEGQLARIKEEVAEIFIHQAMGDGKRPSSFVGRGVVASASCELKKRASHHPVDAETYEILVKHNLESCVDKTIKSPQRFTINQDLSQEVLQRLSDVVMKDPLLKKYDNIVLNLPEEYHYTVSESALDLLAKNGDEEIINKLLSKLSTIAVGKFKLSGDDSDEKDISPFAKRKAIEILMDCGFLPRLDKEPS